MVKSAKVVVENIKCLATYKKESLNNDVEAVTPHPLFTPTPVCLSKYRISPPESSESNNSDDPLGRKKSYTPPVWIIDKMGSRRCWCCNREE